MPIASMPMAGGSSPNFVQKPPDYLMPTVHIPPSQIPPPPLASSNGGGGGGTSFVPPLYTESEKLAQQRAKEIYENIRAKENQVMGGSIRDTEGSEMKMKKQKKKCKNLYKNLTKNSNNK